MNIHTHPTTGTISKQHDHYYEYLARFPLSSEALGPRVVDFKKILEKGCAGRCTMKPLTHTRLEYSPQLCLTLEYTRTNWSKR